MTFSQWMQHHRRSVLFIVALFAVGGILTAFRLPTSLFPAVAFPRVVVSLDAGDRPAEQMAAVVTAPVEEAVRRVPGVQDLQSTSSRGNGMVSINFDWGTDMAQATLQVQAAVGAILSKLPPGTTMDVKRMDPTAFPIIAYSLTSQTQSQTALYELAQYQIRPLLSSIPGIATGLPHEGPRQARPRMSSRMAVSHAARLRIFFRLTFFGWRFWASRARLRVILRRLAMFRAATVSRIRLASSPQDTSSTQCS